MHEFKHHALETSHGHKVKNPRQAIAIALHEAGASNQESPRKDRQTLARTKRRERSAASGQTRAELYEQAKRRDIPGRSRMSKAELQKALRRG